MADCGGIGQLNLKRDAVPGMNGERMIGPGCGNSVWIFPGNRLPSHFFSAGFSSNKSIPEGPPFMNSQITDFAFGGW